MCAVKTQYTTENMPDLKEVLGKIRETVPVGFNHNKEKQDKGLMPRYGINETLSMPIKEREYDSALYQIGTLGGGNHFIEIQKDEENNIWIIIHSGSRNIGKQVADYYNKLAVELNKKWFSIVPKEHELAFLPIDSEEGKQYIREMNYCVDFALANRALMMDKVCKIMKTPLVGMINIAHNYAKMENHFGQNVIVHRKGATLADEKTIGIIPGSQGTSSYIVQGLENKDSFNSCSHGAGRKMGRKQAERTLNLEEEIKKLDDQGILHGIRGVHELDEAPGAYKDIDIVMEKQKDLVEIITKLTPLAVVKG
jgi:tRNA-splicing ligase RtcB